VNGVGTEILRVASSKEGVLDVGKRIGEGDEYHGGELPVGYGVLVQGAAGVEFGEGVDWVLLGQIGGFFGGELVGNFKKYPAWTHQVKWGQIVSEPTMNSQWACWVSYPLPPVIVEEEEFKVE